MMSKLPKYTLSIIVAILLVCAHRTIQFDIDFNGFKSCKSITTCDCLQPTDSALPVEIHCPDFTDDQMQLYYRINATLLVQCLPPLNWNAYNNADYSVQSVIEVLRQNGNISHLKKVRLGSVEDVKVSHCNLTQSNEDLEWLISATTPKYLSLRSNILSDTLLFSNNTQILDSIETLNLENNNLIDIPFKLFKNMLNLKDISLNFNKIVNVNQKFDETIVSLQLAQNNIVNLDLHIFEGLKQLKTLHLWGNYITDIQSLHFHDLENLQALELSRNSLKTLPNDVFLHLKNLKTINLESNQLESLPYGLFSHNPQLESVRIARNKRLTSLPDNLLANLNNLKNVRLNECSLTKLGKHMFENSQNIEVIYLNDNYLGSIDADLFKGLTKLKVLKLSNNRLTQLPEMLFIDAVSLNDLDLSVNDVKINSSDVLYTLYSKQIVSNKF